MSNFVVSGNPAYPLSAEGQVCATDKQIAAHAEMFALVYICISLSQCLITQATLFAIISPI